MLMPAKTKFRKQQRGKMHGNATSGTKLTFGEYGLQALETVWLSAKQIESARKAIIGFLKRGGKVWIRVFPDKPVTMKAAETRMGGGKGDPAFWVAPVKPGRIIFELSGVSPKEAQDAFNLASYKLPIKTRFIGKGSSV
jgi:large subunit ribosomal protein L16